MKLLSQNIAIWTLCRTIRIALGISQEEFAKRVGVKKRTIVRWEKGQAPSVPTQKLLESMAKKLKIK